MCKLRQCFGFARFANGANSAAESFFIDGCISHHMPFSVSVRRFRNHFGFGFTADRTGINLFTRICTGRSLLHNAGVPRIARVTIMISHYFVDRTLRCCTASDRKIRFIKSIISFFIECLHKIDVLTIRQRSKFHVFIKLIQIKCIASVFRISTNVEFDIAIHIVHNRFAACNQIRGRE